ncbi:MAG: Multiple sugar-binding periplasmic receptor ChvE precursor [Spirochaetes bacterium ADurb.Bin315]|nr:sugar ABC transporter substrate-binding protein [Spirochaetota bacterium]OQA43170.1 MAG: Multiple sugar-binding periplasmic receptor ChvE precursor [Spirochaetes bacterium ADurb.Bin315]HOE88718.1 sugar ABC transporter substrate-binding protein [Sphaerochaeta sp.]HOR79436.1 sugar ABC transporter substrate-binding protein [Sphaerochaeta sp.]HPK63907.1 sugar ABC transporter substrate-binding protein [Sphaerochaeta sp.]
MKKSMYVLLTVLLMATTLFAAGSQEQSSAIKIGVSMPTQSLQRWNQDGANMKSQLEAAGYKVDLQYAGDNDIPTQVAQLENMITTGCKVLVIASIDGSSLTEVLKQAQEKKISVIAYDRLIMNTDAVTYYATFDNFKVGTIQGTYIRDALKLDSTPGPYYIELFTGSPDDNNINFFFGGAMSILEPYIKSGKLVVRSGQTTKAQCATPNWSTEEAQKRMENLITANGYGPKGTRLDAVYSSNDSVANGITNALVAAGYTKDNFPILTGQDCDKPAVKNMLQGLQSMSIFKDTRTLAAKVVEMVNSIIKGEVVSINDTTTYDNGIKVVPSFLCEPVFATVDNYKALLIDSGYYTEADLKI